MKSIKEIREYHEYIARVETDGRVDYKAADIRAMKEYALEIIKEIEENMDNYVIGWSNNSSPIISHDAFEELKYKIQNES